VSKEWRRAVNDGQLEVARQLLAARPELVNFYDNGTDTTPLIHALVAIDDERPDESFVDLLLGKGADVNLATRESGTTPLMVAVKTKTSVTKKLLDKGADPLARDKRGRSVKDICTNSNCTVVLIEVRRGRQCGALARRVLVA
jgi:ankyrin repeat protein